MQYRSLRNWKYQITEEEICETGVCNSSDIKTDFIELSKGGRLKISKWYAWDGATFCPDFKSIMQASLIHDALYQLIEEGFLPHCYRIEADKVLKRLCIENGMCKILANTIYLALRGYSKVKGIVK